TVEVPATTSTRVQVASIRQISMKIVGAIAALFILMALIGWSLSNVDLLLWDDIIGSLRGIGERDPVMVAVASGNSARWLVIGHLVLFFVVGLPMLNNSDDQPQLSSPAQNAIKRIEEIRQSISSDRHVILPPRPETLLSELSESIKTLAEAQK